MEGQLKSWLQSSQDVTGQTIANKVKGAILMFSALIILFAAQFFHIQMTANDVLSLATEGGAVAGAIWTIYGSVLHIVRWLGTVTPSSPQ